MLNGSYRAPSHKWVIYGTPLAQAVREIARNLGAKRAMILTNQSLARGPSTHLAESLGELWVGTFDEVSAHTPREVVIAAAAAARRQKADLVVAVGGGSVIDAGKVLQLCLIDDLHHPDALDAFANSSGPDTELPHPLPIRLIAAPTTLSAAEFTPYAGLTDAKRQIKDIYRHPALGAYAVVLDAELALGTPIGLWLSTGMKAVDHAVEQLCHSLRAPFADATAAEALKLLADGLAASKSDPTDREARQTCQFGAWLAISGAAAGRGMGASHAIGHTLGAAFGVPHGLTSAVVLPAVMRWNYAASAAQQAKISQLMGRPNGEAAQAVEDLCAALGLPTRLKDVGIRPSQFLEIAEKTMHEPGVRTNPRRIAGPQDIVEILEIADR